MMRTLPFLVLLPLFIVWFGIGEIPKIVIIALGSMFPMYLNTFSGIRNVDARLVEMGRTYEFGRCQLMRLVILPGALPSMLTGLRYALGVSWLALVVAEQINARNELGYLIYYGQEFFQSDVLLVVIVVYAALGLGRDLGVRLLGAITAQVATGVHRVMMRARLLSSCPACAESSASTWCSRGSIWRSAPESSSPSSAEAAAGRRRCCDLSTGSTAGGRQRTVPRPGPSCSRNTGCCHGSRCGATWPSASRAPTAKSGPVPRSPSSGWRSGPTPGP